MRIITWNVNGIRACLKKGFGDWYQKNQPDVLCLQEVRAYRDQVPPLVAANSEVQIIWNEAKKPGYSGVLCMHQHKTAKHLLGLGDEAFDCEGRLIELDLDDFVLFNGYFPNGGQELARVDFKLAFYAKLLTRVKKLMKQGRQVIVTGDFNTCHQEMDLARPKANEKNTGFLPEERAWMQKVLDAGLSDSFRLMYPERRQVYSWWSQRGGARENNVGWRLDTFLISKGLHSKLADTIYHTDVLSSDHCPVELILS